LYEPGLWLAAATGRRLATPQNLGNSRSRKAFRRAISARDWTSPAASCGSHSTALGEISAW